MTESQKKYYSTMKKKVSKSVKPIPRPKVGKQHVACLPQMAKFLHAFILRRRGGERQRAGKEERESDL